MSGKAPPSSARPMLLTNGRTRSASSADRLRQRSFRAGQRFVLGVVERDVGFRRQAFCTGWTALYSGGPAVTLRASWRGRTGSRSGGFGAASREIGSLKGSRAGQGEPASGLCDEDGPTT